VAGPLLNDPEALEDPVLEERLYVLQDKIEEKLRAAARVQAPIRASQPVP
jgi:hypothetical protein